MIKVQNLVPEYYYNESRDFQLLGRLFEVCLNSVKTNVDLVKTVPLSENSDSKLLELMTLTLGFKSNHNYNIKQLSSLCSAFSKILKVKGTLEAVILAVDTLTNAEGIVDPGRVFYLEDSHTLEIHISSELTDTNLLKDLLDYILPAGISCDIVKETKLELTAETEVGMSSGVVFYNNTNNEIEPINYSNNKTNANDRSIVPTASQIENIKNDTSTKIKAYDGLLSNMIVYRPPEE